MKKIVFIDSEGVGDIGGGQRGLLDILGNLNKNKFSSVLICPGPSLLSDAAKKIGIETHYVNFGNSEIIKKSALPLISFFSIIKVYKILKKNNVELLVGNSYLSGKYAVALSLITKIPAITMIRCIRNKPYLDYIVDLFLINFSKKIICNTKLATRILKKRIKNNKNIATIHNGMNIEVLQKGKERSNSFCTKHNIDSKTKIVGMVAMFTEQKGHYDLFDAAILIKKTIKNVKFVLVGGDFNYSQIENKYRQKLMEIGLMDSFIFTGFINNVQDVISSFDISILLSRDSEGLPRSIMESMALSKPVIATNVGGVPELVEDGVNGFLISPRDVNALANNLKILLSDSEKALNMGIKGRDIIESKFQLKNKIVDFENLFEKVSKTFK